MQCSCTVGLTFPWTAVPEVCHPMQCDSIMSSLEGSHKVPIYDADNGSANKGLKAAAAQENDAHINSESDRQQLLIR